MHFILVSVSENTQTPADSAAARFWTSTKRIAHITPVLVALHQLPVSFRIDFKILLLVFKALKGLAPAYACDLLIPHESVSWACFIILKSWLVTKGVRAFSVWAPKLRNSVNPLARELALWGVLWSHESHPPWCLAVCLQPGKLPLMREVSVASLTYECPVSRDSYGGCSGLS